MLMYCSLRTYSGTLVPFWLITSGVNNFILVLIHVSFLQSSSFPFTSANILLFPSPLLSWSRSLIVLETSLSEETKVC